MISHIFQNIPPSIIMIIGSVLIAVTKKYLRLAVAISLPVITLLQVWNISGLNIEHDMQIKLGQFILSPLHVHPYSLIFSTAFCIAAFAAALYGSLQSRCCELVAGLVYAGSAIGVCFSGDFITLFIYWEIMAIASCVVIFSSKDIFASKAGVRYALIHFLSGVLLMAGIIGQINLSGSSDLVKFNADMAIMFPGFALDMNGIINWLILLGLLINVAAPPFSVWLSDSYPKASPAGSVFLSAFTTKAAVFVLLILFAGTKLLVFVGLFMAFYGIIFAILENDMRRVLSYSIINQVGFMVVGVGIGTDMALNGVAAHAFCHIIYKALLFMSAGSVVYMTGKNRLSDVGGLYHSMKITTICGVIGALSISAFPFTSGFVSKTIIIASSVDEGLYGVWFLLLAASAGVFLHAGIKFPWFVFFGKDSGMRPKDPPLNMVLAMILMAILCIVPAVPSLTQITLYKMLPTAVDYVAYTPEHIITNLQLLLFSGLAFFLLLPLLKRTNTIILDFDWFYRGLARYIILAGFMMSQVPLQYVRILLKKLSRNVQYKIHATHGPGGIMARRWTIGTNATWTIFLLGMYLVVYYAYSLNHK